MSDSIERHWRKLGDLLVERGLIEPAELEYALAIQRENGGLLGEILVSVGFVTTTELAGALGGQHGVFVEAAVRRREERFRVPPPPAAPAGKTAWRPLGRLLVESGLLTESGLERALIDQRVTGRLLGEIVVGRGWVSAEDLARTIASQHGLEVDEVEARPARRTEQAEVFEVHSASGGLLHTTSTFLDATDLAFELIERDDPEAIEIVRASGTEREQVWSYDPAAV
ncbi:MAG: hypothetical protein C5B48_06530 [Candidatus Rokuibacteriota bacterium]|nr:MAG: hypothetical protein C5B48_06530 [Candidatus Rokubacteria bacterium]